MPDMCQHRQNHVVMRGRSEMSTAEPRGPWLSNRAAANNVGLRKLNCGSSAGQVLCVRLTCASFSCQFACRDSKVIAPASGGYSRPKRYNHALKWFALLDSDCRERTLPVYVIRCSADIASKAPVTRGCGVQGVYPGVIATRSVHDACCCR